MSGERAPNAVDKVLGQRVRAERRKLGMSQEALAEALGVTFQQVQKYENGVNRMAASRLLEIAAVLKLPLEILFKGAGVVGGDGGSNAPAFELDVALSTPGAGELLRAYAGIQSPRVRKRVLGAVSALAEQQKQNK